MTRLWWAAAAAVALAAGAGSAGAQPSGIPDAGGMRPVVGAPFLNYQAFVAGAPDWKTVYDQITSEFRAASQRADTARQAALLAAKVRAYVELNDVRSRAALLDREPASTQAAVRAAELRIRTAVARRTHGRFENSDIVGVARQEEEAAANALLVATEQLGMAARRRQDELLNPRVPALLAQLTRFRQARGFAAVPILSAQLADAARRFGMRDVTADFLAWRRTQRN